MNTPHDVTSARGAPVVPASRTPAPYYRARRRRQVLLLVKRRCPRPPAAFRSPARPRSNIDSHANAVAGTRWSRWHGGRKTLQLCLAVLRESSSEARRRAAARRVGSAGVHGSTGRGPGRRHLESVGGRRRHCSGTAVSCRGIRRGSWRWGGVNIATFMY